jgi:PTS system ascorbate-specific IIA component
MFGILIVTHGRLGESLIDCATHVLGRRPEKLEALDVTGPADPQEVAAAAEMKISDLDQGDGVLVLSDVYGATPCNSACRFLVPGRIEGIAGVNLPMLIRVLTYRHEPLDKAIIKALSGGHEGILHISPELCDAATGR